MDSAPADKPFLIASPPSFLGIRCPWAFMVLQPFYAIAWLSFGNAEWFIPVCALGNILVLILVGVAVRSNRFEFSPRGIRRVSMKQETFVPWKAVRFVELHAEKGAWSLVRHDHLRIITRDGPNPNLFLFSLWTGFDKAVDLFRERGLFKTEVPVDYSGRGERRVPLTLLVDLTVVSLIVAPLVLAGVRNFELGIAASRGHHAGIELLLVAGADINSRDFNQRTPLIRAAQAKSVVASRLLLAKGADPALSDVEGKSAADYASESGSKALAALFNSGRTLSGRH
ncbi:MAG: ankyrin repeat domain-containing protein [Deltaproteobacteria bacterium]|nr:ankyrin repeat domain-containing protein [Deltaproteobacteria bacterium]